MRKGLCQNLQLFPTLLDTELIYVEFQKALITGITGQDGAT